MLHPRGAAALRMLQLRVPITVATPTDPLITVLSSQRRRPGAERQDVTRRVHEATAGNGCGGRVAVSGGIMVDVCM